MRGSRGGMRLKINLRRPFYDNKPKGYLESDQDYILNNIEACVILLDRELLRQKLYRKFQRIK